LHCRDGGWLYRTFGAPLVGHFARNSASSIRFRDYEAILPAIVSSCASYVVFAIITKLDIGPTWDFPVQVGQY